MTQQRGSNRIESTTQPRPTSPGGSARGARAKRRRFRGKVPGVGKVLLLVVVIVVSFREFSDNYNTGAAIRAGPG